MLRFFNGGGKYIGHLLIIIIFNSSIAFGDMPSQSGSEIADVYPTWSPTANNIAFVSNRDGNEDIWLISADGKELKNLTNNSDKIDTSPSWSSDGEFILFLSDRETVSGENWDIWIMSADGSNQKNLTADIDYTVRNQTWSPNNELIAFNVYTPDFKSEIWIMAIDGSAKSSLTSGFANFNFDIPTWTANGNVLVAPAFSEGQSKGIVLFDVSNFNTIYIDELASVGIAWSPINLYVLATVNQTSLQTAEYEVSLIFLNENYSIVNMISSSPYNIRQLPVWSWDGQFLAFSVYEENLATSNILKMDVQSATFTELTHDNNLNLWPTWSPDNSKIAFTSNRDGRLTLWRMNSDGSNVIKLIN